MAAPAVSMRESSSVYWSQDGGLHEDSVGGAKRSENPFCVAGWNMTQHSECVGKQQPEQPCVDFLW